MSLDHFLVLTFFPQFSCILDYSRVLILKITLHTRFRVTPSATGLTVMRVLAQIRPKRIFNRLWVIGLHHLPLKKAC